MHFFGGGIDDIIFPLKTQKPATRFEVTFKTCAV